MNYPNWKYKQGASQPGAMPPEKIDGAMRLLNSMTGGMGGASMATGAQQTPTAATGLAGMLRGTGGAAGGAAAGPGMFESAMGGPGGALIAGAGNYMSGMDNQVNKFIASLNGMPQYQKKNPLQSMGAFFDQFTMHGAGGGLGVGNGGGSGIAQPGSIGTMPHDEATEAPGEADGMADDYGNDAEAPSPNRVLMPETEINLGPAGKIAGMSGTDFSLDDSMGAFGPKKGSIGSPVRAPQDKDGSLDFSLKESMDALGPTANDKQAYTQSAALNMVGAGRKALAGGTPSLAGALAGAKQAPTAAPGGMRTGAYDSFMDTVAGNPGYQKSGRYAQQAGRTQATADFMLNRGPSMGMPGIGYPALARLPLVVDNRNSDYVKSKKQYYGGTGGY